jgi:predicted nucleic acid-binding protein
VTVALASAHAEPFPLGRGESEAIHLAKERNANLILLDDKKARRVAEEHGLTVTGTLGILLIAHQKGFVEMPAILRDLLRCGFRLSEKLAAQILADLDHHSE